MESLSGLSEFFYNLVPGVLFIFGFFHLTEMTLESIATKEVERIFIIIIIGFAIGFLGQGIIKKLKNWLGINKLIFDKVACANNKNGIYKKSIESLEGKIKFNKTEKKEITIQNRFHLMDNYLRNNGSPYVINHMAEKAAFWANIFLGSVILLLLSFFTSNQPVNNLLLLLLSLISGILAFEYSNAEYDTVLQTFVLKFK